jgi:hypothetical protein
MPRTGGTKEYRTFVKGLITEASALTFPEHASLDEANFILQRDGSRQRRLGVDYENGYTLSSAINEDNFVEGAVTSHVWQNISGDRASSLIVVQTGNLLHFYSADTSEISANKQTYTIDLQDWAIDSPSTIHQYPVQTASVRGYFIVVGERINPFYISWDKDADQFTSAPIQPKIRDFIGLDDGLLVDERPATLSTFHNYNLLNQGWQASRLTTYGLPAPSNCDIQINGWDAAHTTWNKTRQQSIDIGNTPAPKGHFILDLFNPTYYVSMPSSSTTANVSWSYSSASSEFLITTSSAHGLAVGDTVKIDGVVTPTNVGAIQHGAKNLALSVNGKKFTVTYVDSTTVYRIKNTVTNSGSILADKASSSHGSAGTSYITRQVSTDPIYEYLETDRFSCVASFASRAWYSGMSGDKSNYVFYSRILRDERDIHICHQEADPTSEDISDLVATDGGYVIIPQAGKIVRLVPVRDVILVFADNGVWQIAGDPDTGFTASNVNVTKISAVGCDYPDTVVPVEGGCIYWSIGGIYILQPDQTSGNLVATNMSETTIQTLYLAIPSISKIYAKGLYDKTTKRISWLYNDDDSYLGTSYRHKYNKELIFDTVLQAFTKNEIGSLASNSPYVADYVVTNEVQTTNLTYTVTSGGIVVEADGVSVQNTVSTLGRGTYSNKFVTVVPQGDGTSKITFSAYISPTFYDWYTADGTGVNYNSYLYTGYEVYGDTQREKQVKYLTTHFNRTETGFVDDGSGGYNAENPSSAYLQAQWGWSNHVDSGRWSTAQQVYRLNRLYLTTGVSDPFNYGFSVITTKNKIRGHGKALSLYFYSEAGKDMQLLGWGTDVNAETVT